ncbi:MAG: efflux RND transporter periplasmic adaptor subunit [Bacteroidota bacterium]
MARKKKKSNWLIYTLLGVIVLGLVGLTIFNKNKKPEGLEVETEQVETRTIRELVGASGKVFPETEVKISSDVSGEIVELYVEEGDSVRVGQVLARIDPDTYVSAVQRGKAGLNSAKAQLENSRSGIESSRANIQQIEVQIENARVNHERNEKLYNDGVISKVDFETTLTQLRQLEANLRQAKANLTASEQSAKSAEYNVESTQASLQELNTSLSRTTIVSPTSGVVSQLNVEKGERVVGTMQMAGTEMLRIANLNAMEAQVDVSENDILRVKLGDTATVEVDAYLDRKFKGVVSEIANSASNQGALTSDQVTNFVVKIQIDPNSYADLVQNTQRYAFRPGMSASVDINTKTERDVISVPIQAVTTRPKDDSKDDEDLEEEDLIEVVFVTDADSVRMVEVKTGIQDDDYIHIKNGLDPDVEIVTGPYSIVSKKLKEGETITRKDENKDKDEEEGK